MTHYWGAPAIAERCGWRASSGRHLPDLILKYGIPAYKRRPAHNGFRHTWYASEAMIQHWELSRASLTLNKLIEHRAAQQAEKNMRLALAKGKAGATAA